MEKIMIRVSAGVRRFLLLVSDADIRNVKSHTELNKIDIGDIKYLDYKDPQLASIVVYSGALGFITLKNRNSSKVYSSYTTKLTAEDFIKHCEEYLELRDHIDFDEFMLKYGGFIDQRESPDRNYLLNVSQDDKNTIAEAYNKYYKDKIDPNNFDCRHHNLCTIQYNLSQCTHLGAGYASEIIYDYLVGNRG